METVPNRENLSLVDKGTLLVSVPRNQRRSLWKLRSAGRPRHRAMVRRLVLLATSTSWQTSSLIREGPLLPPVVRRCLGGAVPLVGNEVIQTQRTGRVASVGAAVLPNWKVAGESAARQWRARSSVRLATGHAEDDERADGENPTSITSITG
jgi:hypothetical protein